MTRSNVLRYLRLVLGFVLLGLLFYWVPLAQFVATLSRAAYGVVLLAFLLTLVNFTLSILKLQLALSALGYAVGFAHVMRAYYIGTFFNNFIPTSVGGDLVKTYELNKHEGSDVSTSTLAVVAERLSGIFVLGSIGVYYLFALPGFFRAVGFSFIGQGRLWTIAVLLTTAVFLPSTWWLTESDSDGDSLASKLATWLNFPREHSGTTLVLIFLSVCFHVSRAVIFVLLGWSLGAEISLTVALFVLPVIAFAAFLPISMGGIGLREGIITFCLHAFGVPLDASLGVSILMRLFSVLHAGFGGYLYALRPAVTTPGTQTE